MSGVPDVFVHVLETHFGSHVVLNVRDSMDNITGEQAAGAHSIELWVEDAMFIA